MKFSRQEYWSGWPFPPPGDLSYPGIKPASPMSPALAGGFFTTAPPGKPDLSKEAKRKFGGWGGFVGGPAEPDKQRDFPGLRSIEVRDFPGRAEGGVCWSSLRL